MYLLTNFAIKSIIKPIRYNHLAVRTLQQYQRSMNLKMSRSALVILAEGAEEMETVITTDMLRRAELMVTVAGLDGDQPVKCSRNVVIVPDKSLDQAIAEEIDYDVVVLPGGLEGSERLSKSEKVRTLLKQQEKAGRLIAAICAAPAFVLVSHGIGVGKRITSYPGTKDKVPKNYKYVEGERVVVDGKIITSRGPGTAYWFGLAIIENVVGKKVADAVEKGMILSTY